MNKSFSAALHLCLMLAVVCLFAAYTPAHAQLVPTNDPPQYGPYNATIAPGGDGLHKPLVEKDTVTRADSPWSLYCWVQLEDAVTAPMLVAGIGQTGEEYPRYLGLEPGKALLWLGRDNSLSAPASVAPGKWQFLAATFDGTEFRLYSDGAQIAEGKLAMGRVTPVLQMAPGTAPSPAIVHLGSGHGSSGSYWIEPASGLEPFQGQHFGGKIASLMLLRRALTADEIKQVYAAKPDFAAILFEEGSKPWPVQTRGQAGYRAPQDPATMPKSKAPFQHGVAKPLPANAESLAANSDSSWTLAAGWQMSAAPDVKSDGAEISQANFTGDTKIWMAATVPGTALTTMVDRGVYPDPDYGLNNLVIPESLNKQDYWYRNEFKAPRSLEGRRATLTFEGVNYAATIWMNGQQIGTMKGAFRRGIFEVTGILKPGQTNTVAVRVSPPPHPGIPHEQSILGGPGENGGMMCLDGPTFVATEGWDWIPAIRDRDTGIWQPVTLTATNAVKIGDAQVVTKLPLPDNSRADVTINVPLENASKESVRGTLTAQFDQTTVTKDVTVAPGESEVTLAPSEFKQLTVQNPRLWWPNGYGKPELYTLKLTFSEGGKPSDAKNVRFGIREITYELSLLDSSGHLRRVEYSPTAAIGAKQPVVDVTHQGMRQIEYTDTAPVFEWEKEPHQWVASLAPGADNSPAITALSDTKPAPYLVIKVNGVRIAARGGNWGMDDARKRVSRERLEPYFRLHRDANVNIIRNWVGQNTEETFYDLADEYGLMVWNDFWASTQDYNVEPLDTDLFLANARDVVLRFRNHPSIVMWCGRNEGVPAPNLNEGLIKLFAALDGTRYYSPSSNQVNLQNSGPYQYMNPTLYYTMLNHGFSVETGTPSLSTLESFQHWIPPADQWPVSDAWAYHDWHQSGNGDIAPFMAELEAEFGAGAGLADFERKAQMLNYVNHRAIFEGMNAHLWAPNSGRMLWMTQPAWPSNMWEILSSDYDTQASYYGVKKACEPLHVQLDLSNGEVDVINTTNTAQPGLTVAATLFSLDNKSLLHHEEQHDAAADNVTQGFKLDLAPLMQSNMVLVKLELKNAQGQVLSQNLYWLGAKSSAYRQLTRLAAATLTTAASETGAANGMRQVQVKLQNSGNVVALENKLTLENPDGSRILPAYYSDNYVSLLPGESENITIEFPESATKGAWQLGLRGWNLASQSIAKK